MIAETLIDDDTWSEAPEEDRPAFLFIALAARQRLERMMAQEDDEACKFQPEVWRYQYVNELLSVADKLGISGLMRADVALRDAGTMKESDASLARVLTGIRAEMRFDLRRDSVALPYATKEDVRRKLEELRAAVNASNLSASKKEELHKRIDDAEKELDRQRTGMAKFWQLAGALALASPALGLGPINGIHTAAGM